MLWQYRRVWIILHSPFTDWKINCKFSSISQTVKITHSCGCSLLTHALSPELYWVVSNLKMPNILHCKSRCYKTCFVLDSIRFGSSRTDAHNCWYCVRNWQPLHHVRKKWLSPSPVWSVNKICRWITSSKLAFILAAKSALVSRERSKLSDRNFTRYGWDLSFSVQREGRWIFLDNVQNPRCWVTYSKSRRANRHYHKVKNQNKCKRKGHKQPVITLLQVTMLYNTEIMIIRVFSTPHLLAE